MELNALHIDIARSDGVHRSHEAGHAPGPVWLARQLPGDPLVIGVGPLGNQDIPGANRLVFAGRSPQWRGFFISTLGSAGAPLRALGLDALVLVGRAATPSALIVSEHGVRLEPLAVDALWDRRGIYGLLSHVRDADFTQQANPRVLGVGPAAATTRLAAVASTVVKRDEPVVLDTWAGRGGFGSRLFQQHGLAAIVLDAPADIGRSQPAVATEAVMAGTTKYRYHPLLKTGGTLGSNLATLGNKLLAFNDRSMFWSPELRGRVHTDWIEGHYLRQFNEQTNSGRKGRDCGETCPAVCKKITGGLKKDYQPYAAFGPQIGVFDQRAAEHAADAADALGYDAIEGGALVAWAFDCITDGVLAPEDVSLPSAPHWDVESFDLVGDSLHNAHLAAQLLHEVTFGDGELTTAMRDGLRAAAAHVGGAARERASYCALGRHGSITPNHYWTPGIVAPVPIPGKYYTDYSLEFVEPRELGRRSAERFVRELALDNLGMCRFQRAWAEDRLPEFLGHDAEDVWAAHRALAREIAEQQQPELWETERSRARVETYLREALVDDPSNSKIERWVTDFDAELYFTEFRSGLFESLACL